MVHPIEELRGTLAAEFNHDLPPGVHPIRHWCDEPQFFPGASGLPIEAEWDAVRPGSRPPTLPEPGLRRVLVLGNYFATLGSYQRLLAGDFGGFAVTWRNLRRLLSPIEPRHVFLTNAYIGLPDLDRDTAAFPKTASFVDRCHTLFEHELRLFGPTVVVCLGGAPVRFLAERVEALGPWRRQSLGGLVTSGTRSITAPIGDHIFTAVAVRHPAAVISRHDRTNDAAAIADAAEY